MIDIDTQLAHLNAKDNHDVRQRAAGMRFAAQVLRINVPAGHIQAATVRAIAQRLIEDAAELERRQT